MKKFIRRKFVSVRNRMRRRAAGCAAAGYVCQVMRARIASAPRVVRKRGVPSGGMAAVSANRPATGGIWRRLRYRTVCDSCGVRARLRHKRAARTMRTARKKRARRLLEPVQRAPVNRRSFLCGADAPGDGRPSVVRRPGDLRRVPRGGRSARRKARRRFPARSREMLPPC